jgi:hypothetical protein
VSPVMIEIGADHGAGDSFTVYTCGCGFVSSDPFEMAEHYVAHYEGNDGKERARVPERLAGPSTGDRGDGRSSGARAGASAPVDPEDREGGKQEGRDRSPDESV